MDMIENTTMNMPVLALRGLTIFPGCVISFDVERDISIRALERAMEQDQFIFLVAQRELGEIQPGERDLYGVGTVSVIRQILRIGDSAVRVMMEGRSRARLRRLWQTEPYLQGNVEPLREGKARLSASQLEALLRQTYANFAGYAALAPRLGGEVLAAAMEDRDPGHLADFIAQNIMLRYQDKQSVLEEARPVPRLRKVNELLAREAEVLSCEHELEGKIRREMGEVQRDHIIREQIRLLQQELGEDEDTELSDYRAKIMARQLTEEVEQKLLKEVDRLAKQSYASAEASVIRNYLDVCLEMPWGEETKERASVTAARKILDRDHFGLEKVKERILEFIAVRQMNPEAKGQIICLVGPPGVGKTSVAISVAQALNRKLARLSLGGVRDEADIRGHRRTYIGAMPGRIVNAISQSGSMNPLLLLDEIDKVSSDHRGDTFSALLEVLDSEQNMKFRDHYVELPIDLSEVLFIATANSLQDIQRPLLDRMEIIEVSSYTENEKAHIAREHLIAKQMEKNGLKDGQLSISDRALEKLIRAYTREAGVRNLERKIGEICRKAARELYQQEPSLEKQPPGDTKRKKLKKKAMKVTENNLEKLLGKEKYNYNLVNENDEVGIVRGLAWTSVGGDTLQIEVNIMPGKGEFQLTGQLGDVMKESAQAGISYIRSVSQEYQIDKEFFKEYDIHIHIPEGAVPKDGPSAGITMATAMLSAITKRKVRKDVAMTGEITLRGRVLPIGGLKEKILAAKNAGIKTICVPKKNEPDVAEISQEIKKGMEIVFVENMGQVLETALIE